MCEDVRTLLQSIRGMYILVDPVRMHHEPGEWEASVDSGRIKEIALGSFTMGIKILGQV